MKLFKARLLTIIFLISISCSKSEVDSPSGKIEITFQKILSFGEQVTLSPLIHNDNNSISSVELFIDNKPLERKISEPFDFKVQFTDFDTGEHRIFVTVSLKNGKIINSNELIFNYIVNEGDDYRGGIVIKTTNGGINGVIAAKNDLSGGTVNRFRYGSYNGDYKAYDLNDGLANTQKFENKTNFNYAAQACLKAEINGFDDWYLPAFNEIVLFEKFKQKLNIPERLGNIYWSSTGFEEDSNSAYIYSYGGAISNKADVQRLYYVRPCRRF